MALVGGIAARMALRKLLTVPAGGWVRPAGPWIVEVHRMAWFWMTKWLCCWMISLGKGIFAVPAAGDVEGEAMSRVELVTREQQK